MEVSILVFLAGGLFLGWSLGANDAANVFGTAVGTRMVKFGLAAAVCSIFVILGAVIIGSRCCPHTRQAGCRQHRGRRRHGGLFRRAHGLLDDQAGVAGLDQSGHRRRHCGLEPLHRLADGHGLPDQDRRHLGCLPAAGRFLRCAPLQDHGQGGELGTAAYLSSRCLYPARADPGRRLRILFPRRQQYRQRHGGLCKLEPLHQLRRRRFL